MADRVAENLLGTDIRETSDAINLLLLGWILLGLIVYIIGNVIATQIRKRTVVVSHVSCQETVSSTSSSSPELDSQDTVDEKSEISEEHVKHFIVPTCSSGDVKVVDWVNRIFSWLFTHRVISPLLDSWLMALNASTRLSCTEHGILIDFKDVIFGEEPPVIDNVSGSFESGSKVIVLCYIKILQIKCDIVVSQFKEREKNVFPFTVNVHCLSGQIKAICEPKELIFYSKFSDTPQVEFSIASNLSVSIPAEDFQPLHDLVCEIISEAFSSSVVHFRFSCFSDFPKLIYDSKTANDVMVKTLSGKKKDEKLFVKIIKATDLRETEGLTRPYCVIEMDDPTQRFETHLSEDTCNPVWEESFMFIVKDDSAELLFEIYSKGDLKEDFLGLGIISIEELRKNPSRRQVISLQSRPFEKDEISGSLTAEFSFLTQEVPLSSVTEFNHVSDDNINEPVKTVETNSRITAGGSVITTTTIKRTTEDLETDLTGTALKELEKQDKPSAPSRSTLVIHSVQRVKQDKSGKWKEVVQLENMALEKPEMLETSSLPKESHIPLSVSSPSTPTLEENGVDRSRLKEKKSVIGNLKKKLSFRKPRSKSAEQQRLDASSLHSQGSNKSLSVTRQRFLFSKQDDSPQKSGSLYLAVPGSSRSSFSEASGISSASSRTYINENSTLVIEANENGIIRRYILPATLINRSKWRKRGIKLHIFNDHIFVAKHLPGSTICQVCSKFLTRRPGKQGYECRDCALQCHKSCHVKTTSYCPNSSVNTMEVEYIQDPRIKKPKSV